MTTYQKQYFYTQTIEHALDFVRDIANNVQRPFGVRYNPYTQSVDVLNNQDKILDVAKELRGDLCIVATALKKVQEKEGEVDPDFMTNFLTAGRRRSKNILITDIIVHFLSRSGPDPVRVSVRHPGFDGLWLRGHQPC